MTGVMLVLCMAVAGDASEKGTPADPARFKEIRSFQAAQAAHLSLFGETVLCYHGKEGGLVDVASGREFGRLRGHAGNIHDAHFSRDAALVATAGYDATVRVWDVKSQKQLLSVEAHAGYA